jgi:hypothetical protein
MGQTPRWERLAGGIGPTAPLVIRSDSASARGRRCKRPKKPAPPQDNRPRPVPGLILLELSTAWSLLSDRRTYTGLRRFPHPWECDPFAIWNVLGLGHWAGFDRAVLLAELTRRAG